MLCLLQQTRSWSSISKRRHLVKAVTRPGLSLSDLRASLWPLSMLLGLSRGKTAISSKQRKRTSGNFQANLPWRERRWTSSLLLRQSEPTVAVLVQLAAWAPWALRAATEIKVCWNNIVTDTTKNKEKIHLITHTMAKRGRHSPIHDRFPRMAILHRPPPQPERKKKMVMTTTMVRVMGAKKGNIKGKRPIAVAARLSSVETSRFAKK